eukprot:Clim_evm2s41 gene=Clim_evmTU2s41
MVPPKRQAGTLDTQFRVQRTRPTQQIKKEVEDPDLQILQRFDLNMDFGPQVGLTRRERWENAEKLGLEPPEEVVSILDKHPKDPLYQHSKWNLVLLDKTNQDEIAKRF